MYNIGIKDVVRTTIVKPSLRPGLDKILGVMIKSK